MISSKVTTSGPYLDPGALPTDIEGGTGWVIGDGVTLTAGHVVFEYNRSTSSPQIVDGSNTIFLDFEDYRAKYLAQVTGLIATGSLNSTVLNGQIEAKIIASDAVAINGGGSVDKNNAGLAWFLRPSDLASATSILSGVTITRYGNTTGNVQGSVSSVDTSGSGLFRFSPGSNQGDSGGAYVIESGTTGKGFVFGSQSAQPASGGVADPSQPAYGASLSGADFSYLMGRLEAAQGTGDVTSSEPTNLIVGTGGGETPTGTYRADIIIGRGGGDTLDDGDRATDTIFADDLLFGGGEDDTLVAGRGNDLLHGGDSIDYSAAGERHTLENDGIDKVDYSLMINRGATDKGLTIFVSPAGTAGTPTWAYGDRTDEPSAVYVVDQAAATDAAFIGSDTLISIEDLSGTDADDTLRLDVTAGQNKQFAGTDGKGGLAKIDLKGNAEGAGKGDLIDASKSNVNWKIDLSAATGNVIDTNNAAALTLTVVGAERVKTADGADTIIGNDKNNELDGGKGKDSFTGGKGDDTIIGGDGEDTAIFSGSCHDYEFVKAGDGTVTIVHARGAKTDGTDTLTGVEWAQFSDGAKIDLTVKSPGCKGQDIAFVVDTTGSMYDDIASVQASASAIINALFDPSRGYTDSRIAVIGYNDPTTSVVLPFTNQEDIEARKAAALAAINSLFADGGGDTPELTYTGLLQALNGTIGGWREDAVSRKIVLFGDAIAKDAGLAGQVYALAANANAEVGGAALMAVPGLSMSTVNMTDVNQATGEVHVVPVQIYTVAIGYDSAAIAEFQAIAANTGGLSYRAGSASDLVDALLQVINLPIYNIFVDKESVLEGDDGTQSVTITITRDNSDDAATVTLGRYGAASGDDVSGLPGSVVFAAGESFKTLVVQVAGDTLAEGSEVFGVSIASISESAAFTNRNAEVTIIDDDQPDATLVLSNATIDFTDALHFPYFSYQEDTGALVLIREVPFKQIVDEGDALPFSISAIDSADAAGAFTDIAVLTPRGVAILDGDDRAGKGTAQGVDGDEKLVIEVKADAKFDFATGAAIQLFAAGSGTTAGQALFYLDGVEVASALADASGRIDLALAATGFDTIVISALSGGLFNVDSISLSNLYAVNDLPAPSERPLAYLGVHGDSTMVGQSLEDPWYFNQINYF